MKGFFFSIHLIAIDKSRDPPSMSSYTYSTFDVYIFSAFNGHMKAMSLTVLNTDLQINETAMMQSLDQDS